MNRRSFLKIFVGAAGMGLVACTQDGVKSFIPITELKKKKFNIIVHSNMNEGHQLFREMKQMPVENIETDLLIVGGGIAGLSAASMAKEDDFILCEMDVEFGGSSGALNIDGNLYSQGAHYDLAYPSNYGEDTLAFLSDLNVISFNENSSMWEFNDKKHVISRNNEEQCWYNNTVKTSVLPSGKTTKNFLELIKPYNGKMMMPTRLISSELNWLNELTFFDYLNKYLVMDAEFIAAIDYQMIDDYGAPSRKVSALAGIHYYTCRPYYTSEEKVQLFSPPEGNYYFANKFIESTQKDRLLNNHLVFSIKDNGGSVTTKVLDLKRKVIKNIISKKAIYAGQKHALKFISPPLYKKFESNKYAPWFVMNIELNQQLENDAYWQNDYISTDMSILGFVNSKAQDSSIKQVLTAYFCFPEEFRYLLKDFDNQKDSIVTTAVQNISGYLKQDISDSIENIHIKLMGHAMPIPYPGYLKNAISTVGNINFAGVDNGRLPLLFEAVDSGIMAYKDLM